MRIISGKYKRHNLSSVPGITARPTTDYIKETLFNVLGDCEGKSFIDLYAGSGSVGLEAISRGAERLVLVEFAQRSLAVIIKNIKVLGCEESCRVVRKKVIPFLKKSEQKFDLVFLDPPYNCKLVNSSLESIYQSGMINPGGMVVVEHSPHEKIGQEYTDKIIQQKGTRQTILTFLKA